MGMEGAHKSRYREVQDRVRDLNKRVLNPATLRLAGRRGVPYGVVRHTGRKSGETYDTPVLVGTSGDRFVVPLIYGTDVDWYRNVRAADGATVVWQGNAYRVTAPRLTEPATVPEAFPAWMHQLTELGGADQYLRLERGQEVPEEYRDVTQKYPARPAVVGLAGTGVALLAGTLWRVRNRDRE